jgi:alpha amylase-like protein
MAPRDVRSCGAVGLADSSVRWCVWAPHAICVELILHTSGGRSVHPITCEAHGPLQPHRTRYRRGAALWVSPEWEPRASRSGGTSAPEGSFEGIIPRLSARRELGMTAIELMPVAQLAGSRNWGYDGVHLYAPQNSYGEPHGLQHLVDACHGPGGRRLPGRGAHPCGPGRGLFLRVLLVLSRPVSHPLGAGRQL